MAYRRPNNLVELVATVVTGLGLGAIAIMATGFALGALMLVFWK